MPLQEIDQPLYIYIDDTLRLKMYDGDWQAGLTWYRDPEVYRNSEGILDESKIPDEDYVRRMYDYLAADGELYFIEILDGNTFIPIGDVTLREQNPPIVIGSAKYRGRGIGRKVMLKLIERAKEIGIRHFTRTIIYDYNIASQRMFEGVGFICVGQDGNQKLYEMELE